MSRGSHTIGLLAAVSALACGASLAAANIASAAGTFNIRDFAPLHEAWQTAKRSHAGIIVSQQLGSREYGLLLARMLRLLDHFTAEEMLGNFVHLEQFK